MSVGSNGKLDCCGGSSLIAGGEEVEQGAAKDREHEGPLSEGLWCVA